MQTQPSPVATGPPYRAVATTVAATAPLWATAAHAADHANEIETLITASTPVAFAFIVAVLVLKVTAFVLGYLIIRLGHDTMIRGVTGDIDFGFSGEGLNVKLKAASPGALFVVAGAAIIVWGLVVQKPMDIRYRPPAAETTQATAPPASTAPANGPPPAATPPRREVPN